MCAEERGGEYGPPRWSGWCGKRRMEPRSPLNRKKGAVLLFFVGDRVCKSITVKHHVQRISKAVVMYDSIAICKQVTVKKRKAYDMAPPAPMATGAEAEGSWA